MSSAEPPGGAEIGQLHRWFAVELNNATWDALDGGLSEKSAQNAREQALYRAYASTYHWLQVGTVTQHGRGEYMIASVAVAIGLLDAAARHCARYLALIENHPAEFADWDYAFAAECRARIATRSGAATADERKAEAQQLANAVADPENRKICLDRLNAPPW